MDGCRSLTQGCPVAVGACVSSAEHDDMLAFGGYELVIRDLVALVLLVLERQKAHRWMNAFELTTRDSQIARLSGSARKHHRIKILLDVLCGDVAIPVLRRLEMESEKKSSSRAR